MLGGRFKSRGKLSKLTWTELALKNKTDPSESSFIPDFFAACTVKVGPNVHLVFGGERTGTNQQVSGRKVLRINTLKETVKELKPMSQSRVSHDCVLLDEDIVLVSGGLSQSGGNLSEVLQDELYNWRSGVIEILDSQKSLGRVQHTLVRIGYRVLAMGGRDSDGATPAKLIEFNRNTKSWSPINEELSSSDTSELVVAPYPTASLDCVPNDCYCGDVNSIGRIYGGTETRVRTNIYCHTKYCFKVNAYPWIAALLRDEDREDDFVASDCSAVLVST